MKMIANNVLVEPIEYTQIGSIVLPDQLKMSQELGHPRVFWVIAVGPGRLTRKGVRVPIECEPGDRVICHSYTEGPKPFDDRRMVVNADTIIIVLPQDKTISPPPSSC
jgi:co-chaperonin GroES (HSP10)